MKLSLFDFSQKVNYKNEIFAGFAVAMTMIPESLSFAIVAGFPPLMGVYAAFLMGLITAILGGRPGMVSGGAGSTTIVLIALMKAKGLDYVFATIILAGLIQFLVGAMKWGKFICLVPKSVMYGFVNGLAIIIFLSQLEQFKVKTKGVESWMQGTQLYSMVGLVGLTMLIMFIVPKFTKAVPATLIAIITVFIVVIVGGIHTKTVSDIASVAGGLPPFHLPHVPLSWATLQTIFPYALVMASVGLTEGLLTLNLVDEMTSTKGDGNRECMAQGVANVTNGFFFGMGGCPMIAQTLVNLDAGSRARLGGIIASLTILVIILFGAPIIGKMPMAALTGVMIVVAMTTFEWSSFKVIGKMPKADIFIGILVAVVTVLMKNLALAVLIGILLSAIVFAWENVKHIRVNSKMEADGTKHYLVNGPLFFGSTMYFNDSFDPENDPENVVIDFQKSRISDMSGIDMLEKVRLKYEELGKQVEVRNLDVASTALVEKAHDRKLNA